MMVSDVKIAITLVDSAAWKLKVLKAVIKFLNWATIPKKGRGKREIVINVKFEIE